jgi:pyruvate dehydrogenase E2 component (dihydrolipoamide acetyltransferase)
VLSAVDGCYVRVAAEAAGEAAEKAAPGPVESTTQRTVLVPDIGEFSGVEVIEVLVAEGDRVDVETSLVTLESDKASMEIPSPFAGVVQRVAVGVGDRVSEGAPLLELQVDAGASADADRPEADQLPEVAAEETEEVQAPAPAPGRESERSAGEKALQRPPVNTLPSDLKVVLPHASPSVRRFARELGADLVQMSGTGPKGRITKEDVQQHIKRALRGGGGPAATPGGALRLPGLPDIDFSRFGEVEEKPLSRIKKLSGAHLSACWLNIPHVTQHDEADITELEAFRQAQKGAAAARDVRLTFLPFLMKACVAVLRELPEFNSSLNGDGTGLIYKRYFHIGVAVDTPDGLVVPVVRDVDKKGILELAAELMEVSARARNGKMLPADMQGGCFSISSLGGIGGSAFTPIVNAPEVAILGVSRSSMQPVWDGAQFQPRLMLPLSLSYDHRVIDGAMAARFTARLAAYLQEIRQLLL